MDTRFWGPSGWRLLHLISFTYTPKKAHVYREFFTTLPYVLPCKFCRTSLQDYMEEEPLEPALHSLETLTKWLWKIHNKVNAKLRGQGLPTAPDPSFTTVKEVYEQKLAYGCTKTTFDGWEFLFSIAENHPFSKGVKSSLPMTGAPRLEDAKTSEERNRWNIMKVEERMKYFKRFWKSLVLVLPFEQWRTAWRGCKRDVEGIGSKTLWIRELWKVRCCMERTLDLENRDAFGPFCKRLRDHKSGCNKTKKARTCRSMKSYGSKGQTKKWKQQQQQ